MNSNDNFSPFSPQEDGNENKTDSQFNQAESFEPIKEVPVESTQENQAPAFNQNNSNEDYTVPADVPLSSEKATEEQNYTAFNPYQFKSEEPDTASFSTPEPISPNTADENGSRVNASYNQPINQGFSQNTNGNSFNNGFNNNFNNGSFNNAPHPQNQQPPVPKDNKNGKLIITAAVSICIIVALIALVSSFIGDRKNPVAESTTNAPTSLAQESTTLNQGLQISTTAPSSQTVNSVWVAEKVRPVVVGVLAYQQGELAGEGSGVLISEDLSKNCTYIVTCAHVINEANCDFSVLLLDGTRYDAEVVALDERTDIGVLKINQTGMQLAEIGDSSNLKFGEPVYAIGNPGGSEFFGSITDGIVSAIDRSISATYTMTCIQHNAAINPGNSGGALVNSAGQVIGINSSKIAKTDYEGMGFAVPSSIFKPVVESLIQYGYVPNRPELGIKYAAVSEYQLYSLIVSIKGLPKESIIIAEIPEGSALSGTQAQVGDLIIAVNGQKMDSSNILLDMIDTGAVGDTLTLTLCRIQNRSYEISTFDVTVKLVEDKGSITTTTQAATLPQQDDYYSNFSDFFDFFNW